ncbi:acyltransferase family protein, partial [Erwinia amylovora]
MNTSTFRGVQALRGIAALSVMLFHFRWNIDAQIPGRGDELFGWGATGVDLFFLISGFVITLSVAKAPQGISGALTFLKKRALRILPAYYIILIISFFLTGAMSTFHYADKTENFISALTFMPLFPDHAPFYV